MKRNLLKAGEPDESLSARRLLKNFKTQTMNILEIFAASRWSDKRIAGMVEMEGKEEIDKALAAGRGVILISAHVGNWELAALYLSSLGYKLYVVAGIQMNALLTAAVRDAKEKRGIEVITPWDSYRKFFKALNNNGVIALLLDGDVYTGSTEITFFGAKFMSSSPSSV